MDTVNAVSLGEHSADLSMWGLFMAADPIVKFVMIALIACSFNLWQHGGGFGRFYENPTCPDPVWKPVVSEHQG